LQIPLFCITSNPEPGTPSSTYTGRQPESRFATIEYQRARKKLRKALVEHYK
jgi:hypothetical protein